MNRWHRIGLIALVCLGFALPSLGAAEKLQVVTTIFPVYDFARQIGGDFADVTLLLPPGVEAHSFSPTPQDVVSISRADLFVYTGQYMEPWAASLLRGIDNENLRVIDASAGIQLVGEGEHHEDEGEHHDDHHHGGLDPHIWLDPLLAQQMAQTIADGFAAHDPERAAIYQERAETYKQQLTELDAQIRQMLPGCKHRQILYGGHFAFGYFTRRYGLKHAAPYHGFSPSAAPSPKNIAELIDNIRATGMQVIYYEELVDPKIARIIAEETGATMLLLHGAHNISRAERERGATYLSIMQANLEHLKKGLECH